MNDPCWVILSRDLPPQRVGGVASWTDDLARALAAAGHRVVVLCEADQGPSDAPYERRRMRGRSWAKWGAVWAAGALARLRMEVSVPPRAIIAATWPLALHLDHVWPGVPLFAGAHGSDITALAEDRPPRLPESLRILSVSKFLESRVRALGLRSAGVLPWPLRLPADTEQRGRALVVSARMVPGKGLLDAVVLAQRLGRPLEIVGDGPMRPRVLARAEALSVDLTLHGEVPRTTSRRVLSRGAAAVLLSEAGPRPEGLGLCLLEAAAAGVPAIGRAVGGVPEAVGPGVTLPVDMSIESMNVQPCVDLLEDSGAGARAREWVCQHHGAVQAVRRLEELL